MGMPDQGDALRIAVVQFRPLWLRKRETTDKVVETLTAVAGTGAELAVFPEACLAGYPFWICRTNGAAFEDPRQKRAYGQYLEAAVEVDGPEVTRLVAACQDLKIACMIGVNERGSRTARGTVYCTLLTIHPDGGLLRAHRKLMPTYDEHLCWGLGDARDLGASRIGAAMVGGLSCWENWMPLARHALQRSGTDVHVNVWPGNPSVSRDAMRFVALEGRVWSVAASGVLSLADVPDDFEFKADLARDGVDVIFEGGSAILAPDGSVFAAAEGNGETILSATLSMATVREARLSVDPTGHFSRPDVLKLSVVRARDDGIAS